MRTINNIFGYMLLALCAVAMLSACQNEGESWVPAKSRNMTIELCVSAAELTRATPTTLEQKINTLRIYAFYNDKAAGYLYREVTEAATPFYMDLNLPESGVHNVEFYIVANEAEMIMENSSSVLSEGMTKAQLEQVRFTSLQNGGALPMYCKAIKSVDVDAVSSAINTQSGHNGHILLAQRLDFDLSRSIAKLSVYCAKVGEMSANPQIHQVELLSGGTRQYNYLFPQSDVVLNGIPSLAGNRALLNSVATITSTVEEGSSEAKDPANYDQVVTGEYISEVACGSNVWNVASDYDNAAVLRVEYTLGLGTQIRNAFIYLPVVARNHHIKVCILVNAEGQIAINYEVADWTDSQMQDYHFDYPTHSYLMESIPTTIEGVPAPSTEARMSENVPFKAYFQMSKPGNDAWTPTLLGLNGSNCEIIVYDVETNQEVTTFPVAASNKWYRIEVWPLTGKMEVGEHTMVAITYTASGFVESEFLLINGSNLNYYWPYSGTAPQDANYVIITMEN